MIMLLNAASAVEILFSEFSHVAVGDAIAPHELLGGSCAFNQIHDHKQRVHTALRVAFLVLLPIYKMFESYA